MGYPEQIQKQIDEAKEIEKRLRGGGEPTTPEQEEGTPAEPAPEPQPDSEPAPADPQPEPEPSPEPTPEPDNEWKVKYEALVAEMGTQPFKTLQGKYSSEVPKMAEEIRELKHQIAQLSKPKEEKKDEPQLFDFDAKEEEYQAALIEGDIEKIKTIRREIREAERKLLTESVQPRIKSVEQAQAQTAVERFTSSLTQAVPEWETLNYDQGFMSWLQTNKVPYSNITLQDALSNAAQQFDTATTIQIFNAYKEAAGLNKPPEPEPEKKPTPKPDVAPPKSRTAAPPAGKAEPKIWTQAEISQAYTDATRGKYTAEQWTAIEDEINKAMLERRVR